MPGQQIEVKPKKSPLQKALEIIAEVSNNTNKKILGFRDLGLTDDDFIKILPKIRELCERRPGEIYVILLKNNITKIPDGAFKDLNIHDLDINENPLTEIGREAFANANITYFGYDESNKEIYLGPDAFNGTTVKSTRVLVDTNDINDALKQTEEKIAKERKNITQERTKTSRTNKSKSKISGGRLEPLSNKNQNPDNPLNKQKLGSIQEANKEAKQSKWERLTAWFKRMANRLNCTTNTQVMPFDGSSQQSTSNLGKQAKNPLRQSSGNKKQVPNEINFLTK